MLFGNITKQRKIGNLTEENILLCNIKTRNTYLHKYFCNAHKGLGLIIIHKKRTWYLLIMVATYYNEHLSRKTHFHITGGYQVENFQRVEGGMMN